MPPAAAPASSAGDVRPAFAPPTCSVGSPPWAVPVYGSAEVDVGKTVAELVWPPITVDEEAMACEDDVLVNVVDVAAALDVVVVDDAVGGDEPGGGELKLDVVGSGVIFLVVDVVDVVGPLEGRGVGTWVAPTIISVGKGVGKGVGCGVGGMPEEQVVSYVDVQPFAHSLHPSVSSQLSTLPLAHGLHCPL